MGSALFPFKRAAIPEAKIVFIGDGLLRPQFEELVRNYGLKDHVLFLGMRRDVPEILSCGDVFAFPSFAEGLQPAEVANLLAWLRSNLGSGGAKSAEAPKLK